MGHTEVLGWAGGEEESAQTLWCNIDKTKLRVFWIVSTPQGSG